EDERGDYHEAAPDADEAGEEADGHGRDHEEGDRARWGIGGPLGPAAEHRDGGAEHHHAERGELHGAGDEHREPGPDEGPAHRDEPEEERDPRVDVALPPVSDRAD